MGGALPVGLLSGRTKMAAMEISTKLMKPRIRRAHRYPTALMAACTILEMTRPPNPDPEIAMPTLRPRRSENHCCGALIHGNQTRDAPTPARTPCVK